MSDQTLLEILSVLKDIRVALNRSAASAAAPVAQVADDADLDGQYGDEVLKLHPRDWHGENIKGARMSQCPPEALDLVAAAYTEFARWADSANKTDSKGRPASFYDLKTAARARGWAKRLRANPRPAQAKTAPKRVDFDEEPDLAYDSGDIPF